MRKQQRKLALHPGLVLVAGALLLVGCGAESDLEDPSVNEVEMVSGGEVVTETDLSFGDDNTIPDKVPLTVNIDLVFSEPVSIESVQDNVVLRTNDTASEEVPLTFEQSLTDVTVQPEVGFLEASTLYVLEIQPGIQDTAGNETDLGYLVNFATMEAQ